MSATPWAIDDDERARPWRSRAHQLSFGAGAGSCASADSGSGVGSGATVSGAASATGAGGATDGSGGAGGAAGTGAAGACAACSDLVRLLLPERLVGVPDPEQASDETDLVFSNLRSCARNPLSLRAVRPSQS